MPKKNALLEIVHSKLEAVRSIGFARSVGILAGGTALAQAVSFLALPLITRIYTPADFNLLAVFVSLLSILSVSACLRFEIAIPLPNRDSDAANLLALSLCCCTAISLIIAAFVWWLPNQFFGFIGLEEVIQYLWLLPIGVWMGSAYSAAQFWLTRKKNFKLIAGTRMTQALGGSGTQLAMGWLGVGPLGLLLGQIVSSSAGLLSLLRRSTQKDKSDFLQIRCSEMRRMLREYDRFPKYATFEALANIVGIHLPVIIIAALAIGPEAGYLMLATRVMTIPMNLIGGAIAQVYLSRAASEFRDGALAEFSLKVLSGLFRVGAGPLLALGILAPTIFAIAFGKEWGRSGELVLWMIPWFLFQFLASPISMAMHVTGKQREMLAVTIIGLLIRIGAVILASQWLKNHISEIYAIAGGIFYFSCLLVFSRSAGIKGLALLKIASTHASLTAKWACAAIIFRLILSYF